MLVEGEGLREKEDREMSSRKEREEEESERSKLTLHDDEDILQDLLPHFLPMSIPVLPDLPCSISTTDHLRDPPSCLSSSLSDGCSQLHASSLSFLPSSSSLLSLPRSSSSQQPRLQRQAPPHEPPISYLIPPRPVDGFYFVEVHRRDLKDVVRFSELERISIHPKTKEPTKDEGRFRLVLGRIRVDVLLGDLNDSSLKNRIGTPSLRAVGGRGGGRKGGKTSSSARRTSRSIHPR